MYLLYARCLLSQMPSTCTGRTMPRQIRPELYLQIVKTHAWEHGAREEQQTKPPCRTRTSSGAAAHDAHKVLVHPWNKLLLVFCNEDGALQPVYQLQHVVPNFIDVPSIPF